MRCITSNTVEIPLFFLSSSVMSILRRRGVVGPEVGGTKKLF